MSTPDDTIPHDADADPLRAQIFDCLDLLEREGPAAVERYLDALPDASGVRERLSRLREFGLLESIPDAPPGIPERLGPFLLRERIGAGGMGVVYRAEQEPLGREVAVKMVRLDHLFEDGARERFRREVEVIARLKHPGIVPVYSGGEEGDIPYYAMELVDGCSLDQLLNRLAGRPPAELTGDSLRAAMDELRPARDRPDDTAAIHASTWVELCLRLAVQAADALEHAHRHGVLHRDVKPSNLMVTRSGRLLLLDFGLAHTETGATLTRSGSLLGSLPYMAPEQIRGGHADARSEVYSLGVVLYQLLTLHQPFWDQTFEGIRQRVLAAEVPPLRSLNPAASWEVETLCLCAMEQDPERRYASAGAFARDLHHVLENRPIAARRPGPVLRLRRAIQRHPALSVGVVLGLALLAGSVVFGLEQMRSNQELREANANTAAELRRREEINRILEDMLTGPDPWIEGQARDTRLVDVLRRLQQRLELRDDMDPVVESEVKGLLGNTLANLGFREEAEPLLERHLALQATLHQEGDVQTLRARHRLANLRSEQGRREEARDMLESCWADCRRELPEHDVLTVAVLNDLALEEHYLGNLERARELYEQELAICQGRDPVREHELATVENNLGALLIDLGDVERAEALLRESLALREKVYSAEHARTLASRMELVRLYQMSARFEEAEALLEGVPEILDRLLGPAHSRTMESRVTYAQVLQSLGKLPESEAVMREVLDLPAEAFEPVPGLRRMAQAHLAIILVQQGRAQEADDLSREAFESCLAEAAPPEILSTGVCRGSVLSQLRRWPEAERALRSALDAAEKMSAVTVDHLQTIVLLAGALEQQGRPDEALDLYAQAPVDEDLEATNVVAGILRFKYGLLLMGQERFEEAEVPLLDAYDVYRAVYGEEAAYTQSVLRALVQYYEETEADEEAAEYRQKLTRSGTPFGR